MYGTHHANIHNLLSADAFSGESKTVKNVLSDRASTLTQMGELTALHRPHSWTKKDGKGRETERRGQRKEERGEDRWETDRVGVNEDKKEREKEKKGEEGSGRGRVSTPA